MHPIAALLLALAMLLPAPSAPTAAVAGTPVDRASAAASRGGWRVAVTNISVGCDAFAGAGTSGAATVAETVSVGDRATIVVTLCSNPSTGFAWETPTYDRSQLRLLARGSSPAPAGTAGGAGTETFTFSIRRAGTGTIRFAYSQPWTGGRKAAWVYVLTVSASAARPVARSVSIGCEAFDRSRSARGSGGTSALSRTVSAPVGGTVAVRLCSNPSTGFAWDQPAISGSTVKLVDHTVAAPGRSRVGSSGSETWTFQVLATGTSSVRFTYSQPWAGGQKAAWTLDLTVMAR